MSVVKVIELIGTSEKGFDDAVEQIVRRATETLRGVSGVDVVSHKMVIRDNKVTEYRVVAKVAFGLEEK